MPTRSAAGCQSARPRELALPRTAARPGIDLERPACFGSFRRRAVKQPTYGTDATPQACDFHHTPRGHARCSEMRIGRDFTSRSTLGAILLFTMSDITHPRTRQIAR